MLAVAGFALLAAVGGSLMIGGNLLFRDDLANTARQRQDSLQQRYEQRIATLRAQIDRIKSRQLLDQELTRRKVDQLLERQKKFARWRDKLDPVLGPFEEPEREEIPVPSPRPDIRADLGLDPVITGSAYANWQHSDITWPIRGSSPEATPEPAPTDLSAVEESLRTVEKWQVETVAKLAEDAYQVSEALVGALDAVDISVEGDQNVGGPFIPLPESSSFEEQLEELDDTLANLDKLKQTARQLPFYAPVSEIVVTSRFGTRRDPILGHRAHHSGVDFRARAGAPVHATAPGMVAKAGWSGGYGRMVEIDHGNGFTTRYAHLDKVLVDEGEQVDVASIIGRAGSSGRSTGPHLHYELRRNDQPTDPMAFIRAGRRIAEHL